MQIALAIAILLILLVWWNKQKKATPTPPGNQTGSAGTAPNVLTGGNSGAVSNAGGSDIGTAGSGAGAGPGTSGSFPTPTPSTATDPMDAIMKAQGATWKGIRPGYAPMYEKPDVNPGIHFDWINAGYTVIQL